MLNSIFLILFFQLVGEFIQKFLEISIPGPVIGLLLLLTTLLLSKKSYYKIPVKFEINSHGDEFYTSPHLSCTGI